MAFLKKTYSEKPHLSQPLWATTAGEPALRKTVNKKTDFKGEKHKESLVILLTDTLRAHSEQKLWALAVATPKDGLHSRRASTQTSQSLPPAELQTGKDIIWKALNIN